MPFFFQRQRDFPSFWTILRDPAKTFHTQVSCPAEFPPAQSPFVQVPPQLQLWKLISLQHHWAHTCTPCRYHLWGMGKPVLHCQNTVMVCFQSRACGCKQAKPVWVRCTELGGKEDRHKDPQSCFVEFNLCLSCNSLTCSQTGSPWHVAFSFSSGTRSVGTLRFEIQRETAVKCRRIFSLLCKCNYYCNVIQLKITKPVLAPNVISP